MKNILFVILLFISFSVFGQKWTLGVVPPTGTEQRINQTTQLRKGTKPNQFHITRGDGSVIFMDKDTIAQILGIGSGSPVKYYTLNTVGDTSTYKALAQINCPSLSVAKLDSCNVAYLFMFNCSGGNWELFKTPNISTSGKTLFVDEITGNDATAKKGCPTCAFKTIDAALNVISDGDLLKVLAGNYTSSVQVAKGFNIDCDNGVHWNLINSFISANTYTEPLNWKFDHLYHVGDRLGVYYINELKNLTITANIVDNIGLGGSSNNSSVVIEKCIDCFVSSNSITGTYNTYTQFIKNTTVTKDGFVLSDNQHSDGAKSSLYYNNIVCNYNVQGNGMINYNYATDVGINKNYTLNIENLEFNPPGQYTTAPNVFDSGVLWGIPNSNPNTIVGYARAGWTAGTVIDAKIRNFSGTGHGYAVDGSFGATTGKKYLYYKVQGHFKKGFPFFSRNMQNIQDATIIIDFDVECDEGIGCYIGVNNSDTNPSCKFVLRGRIKTNGKPCIAIAGNSNTAVTLDNLTMVNVGGTYSVESNQNNNIVVKPGCASNVLTSPNVTQLGTGIYVDPNFNN